MWALVFVSIGTYTFQTKFDARPLCEAVARNITERIEKQYPEHDPVIMYCIPDETWMDGDGELNEDYRVK